MMSLFDGQAIPARGLGPDNSLQSPPDLYASLSARFGPFDLDACASDANHLAPRWFTADDSCLLHDWSNPDGTPAKVFCNPPYANGRFDGVGPFVDKALEEALAGRASTLLIFPAKKREQDWWDSAIVAAQRDGATGIIDCTGPMGHRRIDFWRGGAPVGSPNHASSLVWFQAGLVSAEARWHYSLPWTGTLWLPGYQLRLPRKVIDGNLRTT